MARETFSSTTDDSMAMRVAEILRRRWKLAAASFLAVLAAAGAFAVSLPDLYQSTALVLVERPVSESVVRAPVAGELESRLYVIKQEILSRDRLTALIKRFDLYPELRARASWEDVLHQARQDVLVEPAGPEQVSGRTKTVAFTLSYTGDSREKVAEVTNAVAAFYVEQNDRMRTEEATRTSEFLATQLADAKRELERHEAALRDFTANNVSELPQQAAITLATIERLNNQLALNGNRQLRILDQRDELFEAMRTRSTAALAAAADPNATPASVERLRQLDDLKAKLAQAELQFAAQHPDVRRLKDQIAALEAEHAAAEASEARTRQAKEEAVKAEATTPVIPQQGRRTLEDLDAELAALRQEEADVKSRINDLQQRLESTPWRQQEYTLISRDYSAAKDVYDSLFRRYEEAQLTASVETGRAGERFRVLERALPPEGPAAPNRVRLIILGLLLAAAAAGAAVLLREQFDTSFHTVDEIREFTGVPVLVSIPPIGPAPAGRRIKFALATVSTLGAIALIAGLAAYVAGGNGQLVRLIAF
jgi:polysaccharide chain length determinant protein (PEP-CTERM system associated)